MLIPLYDSNSGLGCADVRQLVLECLSCRACGSPWLLAGDRNVTPDEGCSLRDEGGNLKTEDTMATEPLIMGLQTILTHVAWLAKLKKRLLIILSCFSTCGLVGLVRWRMLVVLRILFAEA